MIGATATAKAEQFYTRSGSESTKGSRKGFSLLVTGENPVDLLTPEEQRDSLKQKLKKLHVDLAAIKYGPHSPSNKRRLQQLGQEINETNIAINQIRAKARCKSDVKQYFIHVCRETMSKPQFNAIMGEAVRRLRSDEAKGNDTNGGAE